MVLGTIFGIFGQGITDAEFQAGLLPERQNGAPVPPTGGPNRAMWLFIMIYTFKSLFYACNDVFKESRFRQSSVKDVAVDVWYFSQWVNLWQALFTLLLQPLSSFEFFVDNPV